MTRSQTWTRNCWINWPVRFLRLVRAVKDRAIPLEKQLRDFFQALSVFDGERLWTLLDIWLGWIAADHARRGGISLKNYARTGSTNSEKKIRESTERDPLSHIHASPR